MKTDLTQEQINEYQENGVLAIREFLTADEVAELKAEVVNTVKKMGVHKVTDGGIKMEDHGEHYYDHVFTQKLNLWRINDTIKSYMLNPKLGEMLCKLEGQESFRCWHDQALIKEPYGNGTAWHLDNPYWSFYSKNALSIWIALEDATLENGCMWFVPGTHKLATYDNAPIGMNMGDLFKVYPQFKDIEPVAVPMKAGDCSFHNGLTAHGAGTNMTRGRRIAMTCAYMPAGSTYNGQQNILSNEYAATLKEGDLLENDDWNPVVGTVEAVAN